MQSNDEKLITPLANLWQKKYLQISHKNINYLWHYYLKNQIIIFPIKNSIRDIFFKYNGHNWFTFNFEKTLIKTT